MLAITEDFLTIHGQKIYVKKIADEKCLRSKFLVLLHEGLGCVELWRDFPEKLAHATGLSVLLYDRFGHGKSDAILKPRTAQYLHEEAFDILPKVLDAYGIEQPIFVGHSDGGSIALLYGSMFADKTEAIITEAAHTYVDQLTLAGIQEAVVAYQKTRLKQRLSRYHGNKTDELFHAWCDTWLAKDFLDWNIVNSLSEITCPVLAIQGENDQYGEQEQAFKIVRNVSGDSKSMLIPSCYHSPHFETETTVLDAIQSFIFNLSSPTTSRY